MVEHLTFNQGVAGSNPALPTIRILGCDVRGLAGIAESLIKESSFDPDVGDIFEKWSEIVGQEVSKNIEPYKVIKIHKSHVLIVKAKNCCATEIQHNSFQLIDKLNEYLKKEFFSVVRVIQG